MTKDQALAGTIGGILLPLFEFFYGEGKAVLGAVLALAFFIGLDWLSGTSAARKDRTYASHYGIDGVFRSFFMLLLPAGGHLLDEVLMSPGIVFGVLVAGLLYHTIKSMTANAVRAGWANWLPISVIDLVTEWVQSEIESKLSRSLQRRDDRSIGR
ncbi:phage holin family protein [Cohnella sp. GCM10027633]|uniref:phage holin family protein n=1 Tax=unclassified Cohnella TaxID=2636738 RepID=UPI0036263BD1